MRKHVRVRFWLECLVTALSIVSLGLTLVEPQWIEKFFGIEPDGGSGSLEWGLSLALVAVSITSAFLARREWRRSPAGA
jgi:hypothetical protein